MRRNKLLVLCSLISIMMFWGCGSDRDSGGDSTGGADTTLDSAATVGMNNCLTCHSPSSTKVQDYLISRHGNHLLTAGRLANDSAEVLEDDPRPGTCDRCHDPYNDGANLDLDYLNLAVTAAGNGSKADWSAPGSVVGCEACHGGGQYHRGIGPIPYPLPGPNQCGNCHPATPAIAATGIYDDELHHATSSSGNNVRRNISDSHYDNPATSYASSQLAVSDPLYAANILEGYAIRYNDQTGCVDCHFNLHESDLSKNYEWARSAHAGHIKEIKDTTLFAGAVDAATLLANVTAAGPDENDTFAHYDWDASNRASCQRCHTATGAKNYLNDPANYNSANNNFSHLAGWTTSQSSGQNELLYCWGCHADNEGRLRDPGAITADYGTTYPDINASNVCMACHIGRESGDSVAGVSDFTNGRFVNSHYLAAGGTVFTATGYEYDVDGDSGTDDYANSTAYEHDEIGMGTNANLTTFEAVNGTDGPCVGCHMSATETHLFLPVTKSSGTITAVTATVCDDCHGASSPSASALNTAAAGLSAALQALAAQLNAIGHPFLGGYPYFSQSDWTNSGAYDGASVMGAAFNFNLLEHDPGAYAHNSVYTKRLIFDSIDYLDDTLFNNSVSATIGTLSGATTWGTDTLDTTEVTNAQTYLGATRP